MTSKIKAPLPGYSIYDPGDPFEVRAGPFFWKVDGDGRHSFLLQAEDRHCNSHGVLHGGLLMTMIDLALVAVAKRTPDERYVTVSLNVDFMAAGRHGDVIEAQGECLRRTRSMAFVRGQITCGDRTLISANSVLKAIKPRADT